MVRPQPLPPLRLDRHKSVAQHGPLLQFDAMALAIVEAERFDPLVTLQGPGETGRRILAARKQHQSHGIFSAPSCSCYTIMVGASIATIRAFANALPALSG